MKKTIHIEPAVFDTKGAAIYTGKSDSYIRNERYADMERIASGELPKGPEWTMEGRNVRYYRKDLDAWLNSFKGQNNPAWDYRFQSDTTHLKNKKSIEEAESAS